MEMSFCHKVWYSNSYIFATQCGKPLIFQTMNFVRSNDLSLIYKRLAPSGWKDLEIYKFKFLAKTQFLCHNVLLHYNFRYRVSQ